MPGFETLRRAKRETDLMPRWINLVFLTTLLFAGFVQSFWGNDPYLGWAITVIAGVIAADPIFYCAQRLRISKWQRQVVVTVLISLILWVSLGVGELPEKIEMMLERFPEPWITGT